MPNHFYFAGIINGKVAEFNDATSLDLILRNTEGLLVELNEEEYTLLRACHGDIKRGLSRLVQIQHKIDQAIENNTEEQEN